MPPVMVDLAPPAMGERKRRPRCRPWGRESGSRAAVHGEEEEEVVGHGEDEEEVTPSSRGEEEADLAPPAIEKRKRSSPGMGKRKRSSPATGKRGAGRRQWGRGHSRRRSPAADGEEGTGPLPRGRGRSPATEKRALAHGEESVGSDSTQYGGVGLCIGIDPF